MFKKLFVAILLIVSTSAFSQQGTQSPYSFFGLGDLKFKGTVENQSMGGMGVYLDSIHLNLRNPAAYVGKNVEAFPFDGESRPVKFAFAGSYSGQNLKSNSTKTNTNSFSFDYIALSVPMGKFGFGFGILPFTSVGYQLEDIDNTTSNPLYRYDGQGGLNKVFAGLGYQINKNLSIGVDVSYNFGNIENNAIGFQYDSDGTLVQLQTSENNRSDLSGLNYNFGMAYKGKISDKLELSATATYAPESDLTSQNIRSLAPAVIGADGAVFVDNSGAIEVNLEERGLATTTLTLPSRLSLGAGIGQPKKWFIGSELTLQNTSAFSNPIFSTASTTFENSSNISLGGFFIPDYKSFSYFKRTVYRAGLRYQNTGLVVKNEPINEFGISFGLGLPLGGAFSNMNIGAEFGQRGTTNQNLIQETFTNINISLSLNDRWFRKRKYN